MNSYFLRGNPKTAPATSTRASRQRASLCHLGEQSYPVKRFVNPNHFTSVMITTRSAKRTR